jgi:NAD(P)-dependent dehydrogenase (short-subunit alcohol dehydrogenase family)
MDNLDGRVAIVTGASRGIGRQVALELSRRGMTVVVAARTVDPHRRLPGTIGETVAAIEAAGGTALAVRTDVTVVEDLEQLVATAVADFGRIDVLVNNAAETNSSRAPIDEMPRADWLHEFDANVHAPFTLIGAVLPHLRRQGGGLIVNVTSGTGDLVPTGANDDMLVGTLLGYATTKAALNRMANALAPALRQDGVAIVNVDPGFTRTELVDLLGERGLVDAEAAGSMDLTARLVARLVTDDDEAMRCTGQILRSQDPRLTEGRAEERR